MRKFVEIPKEEAGVMPLKIKSSVPFTKDIFVKEITEDVKTEEHKISETMQDIEMKDQRSIWKFEHK